ncbi:hypothetical protein AMELA_G00216480 [Ameiurus melas]|uniref:Uncharacterized protein n=1 Tax=Ameiurus melas TaxID=219545 RepID=A0A7J6A128_AMEME|nr:hypothetical protein AMELA_G00216480 [Ameiurus melas]
MSAPLSSISSTPEEEITTRPPSKPRQRGYKQCYIHLMSIKKEETQDFTCTHWGYIQKQRQTVALVSMASC